MTNVTPSGQNSQQGQYHKAQEVSTRKGGGVAKGCWPVVRGSRKTLRAKHWEAGRAAFSQVIDSTAASHERWWELEKAKNESEEAI